MAKSALWEAIAQQALRRARPVQPRPAQSGTPGLDMLAGMTGVVPPNVAGLDSQDGFAGGMASTSLRPTDDIPMPPLGMTLASFLPGAGDGLDLAQGAHALAEDPSPQMAGLAALGLLPFVPFGGIIKAYHGSPHDFDKFSTKHIGTGEGAQAYGHGLYFAENPDVARGYRDNLSKGVEPIAFQATKDGKDIPWHELTKEQTRAANLLRETGGDFDLIDVVIENGIRPDAQAKVRREVQAFLDDGYGFRDPGRLYTVEIDAEPKDFLDWDKPLMEQPGAVQSVVEMLKSERGGSDRYWAHKLTERPDGQKIFREMDTGGGVLEGRLQSAGIPGIRYLDGGSRGAGEGSSNYVVFDEDLIRILSKE